MRVFFCCCCGRNARRPSRPQTLTTHSPTRTHPINKTLHLPKPQDEIIETSGMDAAVMLRLLRYGWVLFAFCTVWCCLLLMPINGTAGFLVSVRV